MGVFFVHISRGVSRALQKTVRAISPLSPGSSGINHELHYSNHWHYFDELLTLALEKTRADYGDYQHY